VADDGEHLVAAVGRAGVAVGAGVAARLARLLIRADLA
jgi:hypothetical protein